MVSPLKIYLIWHPGFTGEEQLPERAGGRDERSKIWHLASDLVDLFQGRGTDLQGGLGISVQLRGDFFPRKGGTLPREIDLDDARKSLLVPLVDYRLKANRDWTRWLKELADDERVEMLPVAVTSKENTWAGDGGQKMFPLYGHQIPERPDALKRKVMIFCIKLLRQLADPDRDGKPQVFISYHGEDGETEGGGQRLSRGTRIGKVIKEAIGLDCYRGLEAFYAHDSIDDGEQIGDAIKRGLSESDAMIGVLTRQYPEREWPRMELGAAREPVQILNREDCWKVTPLVLADSLESNRAALLLREFAGCTMIRWVDDDPASALEVIDRVLIETVISSYHRCWGQDFVGEGRVVLTWIPDAISLFKLKAAGHLPAGKTVVLSRARALDC